MIHSLHLLKLVFLKMTHLENEYSKSCSSLVVILMENLALEEPHWSLLTKNFGCTLMAAVLKEQTFHLIQLLVFGSVKNLNYPWQFCAIFLWLPQYVHMVCICWCYHEFLWQVLIGSYVGKYRRFFEEYYVSCTMELDGQSLLLCSLWSLNPQAFLHLKLRIEHSWTCWQTSDAEPCIQLLAYQFSFLLQWIIHYNCLFCAMVFILGVNFASGWEDEGSVVYN